MSALMSASMSSRQYVDHWALTLVALLTKLYMGTLLSALNTR